MVEFNINDHVWIKITERGREAHKRFYEELSRRSGVQIDPEEIKEDEDGWSRWQLWHLMSILGSACIMGPPVPFETTIRLETVQTKRDD